jgi:hypothetical protein
MVTTAAMAGATLRPPPGSDVPLDFYENFHGVETVV